MPQAIPDHYPILVGASQATWREADTARTPVDALHEVAAAALADCGANGMAATIDAICNVRFIADTNADTAVLFPRDPGAEVAARLGLREHARYLGTIGGNTPQSLVNHFAARLARGEQGAVLLMGAELMATVFGALRHGGDLSSWAGEPATEPAVIGSERDGLNAVEQRHGLYKPINTYPLFENSLRHHLGHSAAEHTSLMAKLCSHMSAVAAANPCAWRREALSESAIATVSPQNRYIGYPYTRAMNAVLEVDMGAAIILTTAGRARQLGIDRERWIFLRGGVDLNDIWHLSERADLYSSPAIARAWSALTARAGIPLDEVSRFDIYSCFPSAVEVACAALGLSPLDPRGVTLTGGLPFFGGPGNNYSLHAIAQMAQALRAAPGHGLVTANGLYLTKHSLGLYSTEPGAEVPEPIDSEPLQQRVEAGPRVIPAADPAGPATVETWTVCFDREGPRRGIVVARNAAGERIVANTRGEAAVFESLLAQDPIGHCGRVVVEDECNVFDL